MKKVLSIELYTRCLNWILTNVCFFLGFNDAEIKYNKDPEKIKQLLAKHTEFHEILRGKKNKYDGVVRLGKLIKDRAPKTDDSTLKLMESDLKAKWQSVCNKSIDRQRKLEEGLLFSGQFEDAIKVSFFCFQNVSTTLFFSFSFGA